MSVGSLDEAKVLLYGEEQDAFVAARDALVKELRAAKQRDLATDVKALRKPSAVAAEVNRVVRADPAGVEVLLQAAELLRAAQAGLLDEAVLNVSELQTQYRAAVKALAQTALSRKPEVRAALEAATIDVESNDALRSGSLVVVPEPVSMFGAPVAEAGAPADELAERRARRKAQAEEGKAATAAADAETPVAEKAALAQLEASQAEAAANEAKEAAAVEAGNAADDAAASEAKQQKARAAEAAAAAAREAKEAKAAKAAEKAAAAEAKRQQRAALAELKRQRKEVTKQHRAALRAQLDALDAAADVESAIETALERTEELASEVADTQEQIDALQSSLAALLDDQEQAAQQHREQLDARSGAEKASATAEEAVLALAARLDEIEAAIAEV